MKTRISGRTLPKGSGSREIGTLSKAAISKPAVTPIVPATRSAIGTCRSALCAAVAGAFTSQGASKKPKAAPNSVNGTTSIHESIANSGVRASTTPISKPIKP